MNGTSAMNSGSHNDQAAVLTSWKDIARYMGKGVRTVQRWEQDFGLPVRRPLGSSKKAVLARPRDLDAWVAMRCVSRAELASTATPREFRSRNSSLAVLSMLSAKIETARQLRDNNQLLMAEVSAAITALRSQLMELQLRQ
jgi:predicted DNA-binding transcriptional regulator AlpA